MRRILTALTCAACAAAPVLCAPVSGDPAPAKLEIGYTMAFWAIPFGHTEYSGTLGGNSYSARAHFETSGIVSIFWKSTIDTTVNGNIGPHTIAPAVYDPYAQDRNKPMERVKVTFGNAEPVTFAEPAYDTTTYPVSEEQKKEAVDPMSAITSIWRGFGRMPKIPAAPVRACSTGAAATTWFSPMSRMSRSG